MRTLIVSAHLDDESLSCGGLIQDRVAKGIPVDVVVLFGRKYNYGVGDQKIKEQGKHFEEACRWLGVTDSWCFLFEEGEPTKVGYYKLLQAIEIQLAERNYTEAVVPSSLDLNQDHRWLADVCKIALRPSNLGKIERILSWQGIDGFSREANYYLPLCQDYLYRKIEAVACYKREWRESPHPRSLENLKAYHRLAGSRCGEEFAEPYNLIYQKG